MQEKQAIKNKNQFDSCLDKRKYQKQLDDDIKTAFNVGITFTPSYIIGKVVGNKFLEGEIVVGAVSARELETAILKYYEATFFSCSLYLLFFRVHYFFSLFFRIKSKKK